MSPCRVELQRLNTELASQARVIAEAEAPIAKLQAAQAALAAAESRHRAAVDADMRLLARWLIDHDVGDNDYPQPSTETEVAGLASPCQRALAGARTGACGTAFCWNARFRRG